ncbi:MAG: TRAP transporter small permease [Proteobacteria bacterium]|jgi:C4-dicarboxylate transporter, DctQ subunit|nr:TRAP transporter small permease [Pseudomonadota bacterium]
MATILAGMTLLTFAQVVLRYVFNTGWLWSLEATTYSFGALVLIGMSYGVRTRSHIAIDMFNKRLAPRLRKWTILFILAICLLYCGLMFYGSYVFVDRLHTLGNNARDIPAPKWLLTAIMPLGFVLLAWRFAEAILEVLRGDLNVLSRVHEEQIEAETGLIHTGGDE